jgi:hypothetical protein
LRCSLDFVRGSSWRQDQAWRGCKFGLGSVEEHFHRHDRRLEEESTTVARVSARAPNQLHKVPDPRGLGFLLPKLFPTVALWQGIVRAAGQELGVELVAQQVLASVDVCRQVRPAGGRIRFFLNSCRSTTGNQVLNGELVELDAPARATFQFARVSFFFRVTASLQIITANAPVADPKWTYLALVEPLEVVSSAVLKRLESAALNAPGVIPLRTKQAPVPASQRIVGVSAIKGALLWAPDWNADLQEWKQLRVDSADRIMLAVRAWNMGGAAAVPHALALPCSLSA